MRTGAPTVAKAPEVGATEAEAEAAAEEAADATDEAAEEATDEDDLTDEVELVAVAGTRRRSDNLTTADAKTAETYWLGWTKRRQRQTTTKRRRRSTR